MTNKLHNIIYYMNPGKKIIIFDEEYDEFYFHYLHINDVHYEMNNKKKIYNLKKKSLEKVILCNSLEYQEQYEIIKYNINFLIRVELLKNKYKNNENIEKIIKNIQKSLRKVDFIDDE